MKNMFISLKNIQNLTISVFLFISNVYADNDSIDYIYDSNNRLIHETFSSAGSDLYYQYDNLGNLVHKSIELAGAPVNNAPSAVTTPGIANNSVDVALLPTLSWSGASDADVGDNLFYYIYLGESATPPLVGSASATSFQPTQALKSGTTYYWQVVVKDKHNALAAGPVWSFTTLNNPPVAAFAEVQQNLTSGDFLVMPQTVFFENQSYDPDWNDNKLTYEWDIYNDGSIDSTNRHLQVDFTESDLGNITVSLRVEDKSGASSTAQFVIVGVLDTDSDGVVDSVDNCPNNSNADQANLDNDAYGDVCDDDMDGDGTLNVNDPAVYDANYADDTDADGVPDECELAYFQNLTSIDQNSDSDADGVADIDECLAYADPLNKPQILVNKPVATGDNWGMAVNESGELFTWGENLYGQLGAGDDNNDRYHAQSVFTADGVLDNVLGIAAGVTHGLAVRTDGTVYGWGRGSSQLFAHRNDQAFASPIFQQNGLPVLDAVSVASGLKHHVILKSDGTVFSWGDSGYGQLGYGSCSDQDYPVQVLNDGLPLTGVIQIVAGTYSSAALLADGTVLYWGNIDGLNSYTCGSVKYSLMVNAYNKLNGVVKISLSGNTIFALRNDGTVWAAGLNNRGQLNINSSDLYSSEYAVQVIDGSNPLDAVTHIAAGTETSLAVQDNLVFGWGANYNGELLNISAGYSNIVVNEILNFSSFASISLYSGLGLATTLNKQVYAWGDAVKGTGLDDLNNFVIFDIENNLPLTNIGITSSINLDLDNDGYDVGVDNCALVYNPIQSDLDSDSVGDLCDSDIDNDGFSNDEEAIYLSDPEDPDSTPDTTVDLLIDFESSPAALLENNLDNPADWFIETDSDVSRGEVYRSGAITHNETTAFTMSGDFPKSTLLFDYKTSTESCCDYLKVYVDDNLIRSFSSTTSWRTYEIDLAPGTHTLKWEYYKDGSVSSGDDAVWVDNIRMHYFDALTVTVVSPSGNNLVNFDDGISSSVTETSSSNLPWVLDNSVEAYSVQSFQSGDITHSQVSEFEIAGAEGPAELSFYRRVSSESGYDYLRFYVDDVEQASWSGTQDWAQMTYSLGEGTHVLRWKYSKDGSVSSGLDAAWVDDISYISASASIISQPAGIDCGTTCSADYKRSTRVLLDADVLKAGTAIAGWQGDCELVGQSCLVTLNGDKQITLLVSTDTDGDGVVDENDAFPDDIAASVDTDDDGLPDVWNDGYSANDSTTGLILDDDDDNDGYSDVDEIEAGTDPNNANDFPIRSKTWKAIIPLILNLI